MNAISTNVKKLFTAAGRTARAAVDARPVTHLATLTILGTSLYGAHYGLEQALPAKLATTLTAAAVAAEWIQWTMLGRIASMGAKHAGRRCVAIAQASGLGLMQVGLYTLAAVGMAGAGGMDLSNGWPLAAAVALGAIFCGFNFSLKWTMCERLGDSVILEEAAPPPAARQSDAIFDDDSVIRFEKRLRLADRRDQADTRHIACGGQRLDDAAVTRLVKRTQLRQRRAQRAA